MRSNYQTGEANDLYTRSLLSFRPNVIQIDEVRRSRSRHRADVDIELPLTSHVDFGSFSLSGPLITSQEIEIPMHNLENSFHLQARAEDITLIDASLTPRKLSEVSDPRQRGDNAVSIYGPNKTDGQENLEIFNRSEGIIEQTEHQVNVDTLDRPEVPTTTVIEAQPVSIAQLTETGKEASTLDQIHYSELSTILPAHERSGPGYTAADPIVIDGDQIAEQGVGFAEGPMEVQIPEMVQDQVPQENRPVSEKVLKAPSPKRRRLEDKNDTTNTSGRTISFDLGTTQPCAASSAIKLKPPSQSPKLETLPQSQLPLVQKPHNLAHRRRGKARHLLVDEVRQLSKPQMAENFRKGRETLRTRAEILAPGASMMHPRRVRSFYPDRLLALPANFELSICRILAEVWRSKRRQCELGRLDENFLPPRRPSSIQRSRSNLASIRESAMESSREMARGGGLSEISSGLLAPRVSSVHFQDQSTGEKRSLGMTMATPSIVIPDGETLREPEVVNPEANEALVPENKPEEPILEVPIVQQEEQLIPSAFEVPPTQPAEPFPDIPDSYANDTALWTIIQEVFKSSNSPVEFSRLISPRSARKHVAKTFHHLLCLLKRGRVRVTQAAAFEPIFISLAES
ncbi:hypothetical protein Aperf_G00000060692 [Anoplocephala perfoliata]